MDLTPTATSDLPITPASSSSAPNVSFTLERAAAWLLPLGALTTLLVGVGLAVYLGELPWIMAGVIVYALCVAVWIGLCLLKRAHRRTPEAPQTTASPLPRVASAPSGAALLSQSAPTQVSSISESEPIREALIFARYAVWFLPFLALVSLLLANTEAARSHQLKWIQCALFSFAGCLLVWVLHLLRPWIEHYGTSAPATTSGPPAPGLLSQLGSAALPCFSLLALAIALLTAADASQIQWLTGGILSFTGYVVLAVGLSVRTRYWARPSQPGTDPGMGSSADTTLRSNWVIRLAMPATALASVA